MLEQLVVAELAIEPPGPSATPIAEKSLSPLRDGSYSLIARRMTSACDIPSHAAKMARRAISLAVRWGLLALTARTTRPAGSEPPGMGNPVRLCAG